MRTAGVLQMDTPLPDGRVLIRPQDFVGGGAVVAISSAALVLNLTGAAATVVGEAPGLLLRYGMSDDAQQQFGKGAPSGGYQGAQAQAVSTLTPFTTPYGQSGRPPYKNVAQLLQPNGRVKGLKPTAVTVVYSVTAGPLTAFQLSLTRVAMNVGAAPTYNSYFTGPVNLPLQTATMQVITTPIAENLQNWLADPFDKLAVTLGITGGAATAALYGVWVDVAFNYN